MSDAKSIKDPESMIKLWGHECTRVFMIGCQLWMIVIGFLEIWQEKSRNTFGRIKSLSPENMPSCLRYTDPEVLPEHRVYTEVESIDDVKRAMANTWKTTTVCRVRR